MTITAFFATRTRRIGALLVLLSGLAHADDNTQRCTYTNVGSLPIRYVGTALSPAVDGTINDTPAVMRIATGAFDTLLTMNAAARRDLSLSKTGDWAYGGGSRNRLYRTRLKDFSIGPIRNTARTELLVVDGTETSSFDATIGAPFLLQMDMELDLRAKRMTFHVPHDCDRTPLMLWQEEPVVLPFKGSDDPSPNPHVGVAVNGKPMTAVIDSGLLYSRMTLDAAKRAGIDVHGAGSAHVADIGSDRAALWTAPVGALEVGEETIRNARIAILDEPASYGIDVRLGQDFLRAHRVLFAMSQKLLYIAYLGGDALAQRTGPEPWMRAEAEGGNADAQFVLGASYSNGLGVVRDPVQANAWLDKAVAQGQPNAAVWRGRVHMLAGHVDTAIPLMRRGLDQLPADRCGPLWLYVARVRNGEADLAKTELQATLKRQKEDDWPRPIADFYLGRISAARLLEEAGKEAASAQERTCMAEAYMAELNDARAGTAEAGAVRATALGHCTPAAGPASATPATSQPAGTTASPGKTS